MKWIKAADITEPGSYVMWRAYDNSKPQLVVTLSQNGDKIICTSDWTEYPDSVTTWDEEVIFFGPIPDWE